MSDFADEYPRTWEEAHEDEEPDLYKCECCFGTVEVEGDTCPACVGCAALDLVTAPTMARVLAAMRVAP